MIGSTTLPDWRHIAVESARSDADLALLLLASIFREHDTGAADRLLRNARDFYESARAKRNALSLSAGEAATLDEKIGQLRMLLQFPAAASARPAGVH